MKSAKITDLITDKISGEWGEEPNNGNGVKVLRTTNFTNNGRLNLESIVVRDIEERLVTKKQLKFGDTIIEKSGGGPKQPVGRVVYFDIESEEPYLCNNFTAILRPKNVVDSKYFFYSLFAKHGLSTTLKYQNKTTGIINLQLERYLEEEIPLPSLSEQQKIAGILSQVDAAREKRKQANALTEQFLQSTFLTLFGDPVKNEKGWEVVEFGKAVTIEKNTIQSEDIEEEEFYVGLEDIEKDTGTLLGFQKMKDAELKSTKFKFTDENILYGKLRPYLNKVCFPNISGVCSTDILPIRAKEKIASKIFIGYLMKQPFFVDKATTMSNGANLPRISPKILETFKIILPPLSLQQKFVDIVNQTEQLRSKQRQSEQELEQLFQSLLQRYFG